MLSEITRKEIMDILGEGYMTQTFFYLGSLDEIGFFSRLYKLGELPSTDSRFAYSAIKSLYREFEVFNTDVIY